MSEPTPPKMNIKEFRDAGYLQEVNRQFFHPLGLALAVRTPEKEGEPWSLECIYDARDDAEGYYFESLTLEEVQRGEAIRRKLERRAPARAAKLGYVTQPLEVATLGENQQENA